MSMIALKYSSKLLLGSGIFCFVNPYFYHFHFPIRLCNIILFDIKYDKKFFYFSDFYIPGCKTNTFSESTLQTTKFLILFYKSYIVLVLNFIKKQLGNLMKECY